MSSRAIAAPCLGQGSRNFLRQRLCLIERQGDHCVGYVRLATTNLNRTAAVGVRVSRDMLRALGHIHHAYDDLGRRQRLVAPAIWRRHSVGHGLSSRHRPSPGPVCGIHEGGYTTTGCAGGGNRSDRRSALPIAQRPAGCIDAVVGCGDRRTAYCVDGRGSSARPTVSAKTARC